MENVVEAEENILKLNVSLLTYFAGHYCISIWGKLMSTKHIFDFLNKKLSYIICSQYSHVSLALYSTHSLKIQNSE